MEKLFYEFWKCISLNEKIFEIFHLFVHVKYLPFKLYPITDIIIRFISAYFQYLLTKEKYFFC